MKQMHPIMFFGHNSDVLVRFGPFHYSAGNHAGVAFNATIRAENEIMHRFGPKMKRTQPIMFCGPNSDVLVHFSQFRYCDGNHAGVTFNAPIRVENETMLRFGPEMKRMHTIMFLDTIVMFWFVLVHFLLCWKPCWGRIQCNDSGRKRNYAPIRAKNETNAPNHVFWTQ